MANRKRRTVKQSSFDPKKVALPLLVLVICYLLYLAVGLIDFSSENSPALASTQQTETPAPIEAERPAAETAAPDTIVKAATPHKSLRLPQVEILNGCGVSSITGVFIPFFKSNQIDVIATGNYSDFKQQTSFILYHSESVANTARELAKRLSISDVRAAVMKIPTHELTLVLGADYGTLTHKVTQ